MNTKKNNDFDTLEDLKQRMKELQYQNEIVNLKMENQQLKTDQPPKPILKTINPEIPNTTGQEPQQNTYYDELRSKRLAAGEVLNVFMENRRHFVIGIAGAFVAAIAGMFGAVTGSIGAIVVSVYFGVSIVRQQAKAKMLMEKYNLKPENVKRF